ncbi:DHH family phosphoesterase [Tunturiibacter gelidiferens]|uniref:DHH family phosphoesterase n=1 Tax=Tunturiibacter gelidiferens TaxID=3069689 RepID=UPI003D9ADD3C
MTIYWRPSGPIPASFWPRTPVPTAMPSARSSPWPKYSTNLAARPTSSSPTPYPPPTALCRTSAGSTTPSANDVDPTGTTPAILLECDSIIRTGLLGLEGRTLINIDHHASGRPFASVNWIDEHACAVAAMVYHIAVAANVEITPSMASCLYAGILSDTGTFTYSSTTADTFAMAHHLAACGANPSRIARDIYLSNPASKIRLLGIALSNLQCDDDLAWTWVTSEDMDRIGAIAEDCEGVVNYLISIAGVQSAVFLREVANADQFRLSIRSKGETDVARIAERFGGGGHRNASGCTLDGPLPVALERILTQLRTGL